LHAEDVGWPPKKTGETIYAKTYALKADNSETIVKGDFAPVAVLAAA